MADLICRNTMMRCNTPGMCSPHGGCRPAQDQSARIAELERENAELREAHDKEWRRSETNAQNVIAMAAELEACRKDAGYWRYFRDRMAEPGDDVHLVFVEWCWAEASIEDVEAAIDAAMQEGGV